MRPTSSSTGVKRKHGKNNDRIESWRSAAYMQIAAPPEKKAIADRFNSGYRVGKSGRR
jgi:hypothetical protein